MRLSQGPLKETKNDTGEIPDYGATGVTGILGRELSSWIAAVQW